MIQMGSTELNDSQEMEYVGFWPRTGAALIDSLLLVLITGPLLWSIYGPEYFLEDMGWVAGPADFLLTWILPALGTVLFWTYKRATPGKMAISAEVVDARTGESASTGQLIGRYLAYYVSAIPLFIGIIWVAFDSRKQGWHDKLAGTVVVRPRNRSPRPVVFEGDR